MMCLFLRWGIMAKQCETSKVVRKRLENRQRILEEYVSASFEPDILCRSLRELGQCLCYISTCPSRGESTFTCVDLDATITSSNAN
jgi:hypothetical protein